MTLDATRPSTTDLVSALALLGQEERAAINLLEAAALTGTVYTDLVVPPGVTVLVVGTHLSSAPIEIVRISSLGAVTIADISGAGNGLTKIFYHVDGNVSFADNAVFIDLNQLPIGGIFTGAIGDMLTLLRINSVWVEKDRTLRV